jgi:hypothetical protein
MRNRRDDERGFRGMGEEDEGRGYGGTEEQRRTWNREEDMGGSRWSGASGRGGMRAGEGGYGGGWGGPRAYETRHFGGGRGGYERGGGGGYGERGGVMGGRGGGMRGEGWGRAMGAGDLGFGYPEHEGMDRGPHYGKGPKGYRRSDERIREDICETIAQQGYIDASDVDVKVENGVVTLTGNVSARL